MKIAIVEGSHWHTDIHVNAFRTAGCDIVGMSDASQTSRSQLAETYECATFGTPTELIEATTPELVVVLGKHVDMPRLAIEVAATGTPLVLEKPCAISAPALLPLIEKLDEVDGFAAVPLGHRHRDLWETVHQSSATFGHFRIVSGSVQRYLDWNVPWVLDPAASGGGVLRNLGIHAVDAFCMVAGEGSIEVIGARLDEHPDYPGIDRRATALLAQGDLSGLVEVAYTFPDDSSADVEWRIQWDDSYVRDRNNRIEVTDIAGTTTTDRVETPGRYERFAIDVCRRVANGEPPTASVHDAHRALSVIDSIYEAGTTHWSSTS